MYINNRPIGIFGLFGSQAAPWMDNEFGYNEKSLLEQQKDAMRKDQIESSPVPNPKICNDTYILNSRYHDPIHKKENHNLQQASCKNMGETIWQNKPLSDICSNQYSKLVGPAEKQRQLTERNHLDMNNTILEDIATNKINLFNPVDKVDDDHLLEDSIPTSPVSSKRNNGVGLLKRGINLMTLFSRLTGYISLPDINEYIK